MEPYREKRVRSPNYPALSLPDAIEKVTALYRTMHTHAAPRDVVAKGMGYTSLNGASATAISALHKYGLLERDGEEVKVGERALRILHPHSPQEKADAIREAAQEPQLFAELAERFPGRLPNEELLRNYLVRKGFAPSAVSSVILAYRETIEFAEREAGGYDSRVEPTLEPAHMQANPISTQPPALGRPALTQAPQNLTQQGNERLIGRNDLEGGGYVAIIAFGDIETEEVLEEVEDIIRRKRRHLERRKRTDNALVAMANETNEKAIDWDDEDA